MADYWQKFLDFLLGPEAILGEPGYDPTLEGVKARKERKTGLIVLLGLGLVGLCLLVAVAASQAVAPANPTKTPTATITPTELGIHNPSVTLYPPASGAPTLTGLPNLLTVAAGLPQASATPTGINVGNILTSIAKPTATPCATAGHFFTEIACNNLALTATLAAAGVGTPVNVSGVAPNETVVFVYPTLPPTPWIVTASPTPTPVVITATPGPTQTPFIQIITATPGPTQTPWFYITQPAVVTVVWTQLVTQVVEVTHVVVVTATPGPTDTPAPTAVPSNTPIPTSTP